MYIVSHTLCHACQVQYNRYLVIGDADRDNEDVFHYACDIRHKTIYYNHIKLIHSSWTTAWGKSWQSSEYQPWHTFFDWVHQNREKTCFGHARLATAWARPLDEELHVVSSMQRLHHVLNRCTMLEVCVGREHGPREFWLNESHLLSN